MDTKDSIALTIVLLLTLYSEARFSTKTGDDRNYGFWIGLGFIAIGGVISAVILKIKIKKDEDED